MNPARSALLLRLTAGMVIGTLAVTGCGGTTEDATDSPGSTSATPDTSAEDAATPSEDTEDDPGGDPSPSESDEQPTDLPVIIEIRIADGRVLTEIDRVPVGVGDTVRMAVESDVADEVHVHGIEEVLQVEPGQRAVLEFVVPEGTAPGLYEVETHDSALLLLQLEVS